MNTVYVKGTGQDVGKNVLYGFFVWVTIDTFKGYQYLQSMSIAYPVRPTTSASNFLIDLGMPLMALAFRRKLVKGYTSNDQLKYDGPHNIEWKEEAMEERVFLAKSE